MSIEAAPLRQQDLAVWAGFLRAHTRLIETLERELQSAHGISLPWYEVLMRLGAQPDGRMRMQELANQVLLSKSGLSRLVDRLEQAQMVRRESCPSDRRGTFAVLTEAGRSQLQAAAPLHLDGVRRHFLEALGEEGLKALAVAVARLQGSGSTTEAECSGEPARLPAQVG